MQLPGIMYFQIQPEASKRDKGGGARISGKIIVRWVVVIVGTDVHISRIVRPG